MTTPQTSQKKIAPGPPNGMPVPWQSPNLPEIILDLFHQHGPIIRLEMGSGIWHLLAHPNDVRKVLLGSGKNFYKGKTKDKLRKLLGYGLGTSEGELWQKQRRLIQPMYASKAVAPYDAPITAAILEVAADWEQQQPDTPFDLNQTMAQLSMDIICRVVFGRRLEQEFLPIRQAITDCLKFVALSIDSAAPPDEDQQHFQQSLAAVETIIQKLLSENNAMGEHALLLKMARAREAGSAEVMSHRQLRDEVLTIFFAGYEAITQTLTWIWVMLAEHPGVEQKFHTELAQFTPEHRFTAEDLPKLVYTRMVLDETLRLRPHAWSFARDVLEDDELGGYHIPAGSAVRLIPYATHRLPEFWDDPERFDPERFRTGKVADRDAFAYYPFSGGRRFCLGKHLALLEIPLVIATLGARFRLRLTPDCRPKPMAVYSLLRPDGPVRMTVTNTTMHE